MKYFSAHEHDEKDPPSDWAYSALLLTKLTLVKPEKMTYLIFSGKPWHNMNVCCPMNQQNLYSPNVLYYLYHVRSLYQNVYLIDF